MLDYAIDIHNLSEPDQIFLGGPLGNFSLAGFEMVLSRHVSHYIINYYLPSGLFVVVSWISFLVPADVIPGENIINHAFLPFTVRLKYILTHKKPRSRVLCILFVCTNVDLTLI